MAHDAAAAHAHDEHAHAHPSGLMRWLTTTNHKDIGTLYLVFALATEAQRLLRPELSKQPKSVAGD